LGSAAKAGEIMLRCEGTPSHPTDVAGGCACGPMLLNPCGDPKSTHLVDRLQCFFRCAAASDGSFRLRCPDGAAPTRMPDGCACVPFLLSPCTGAPREVKLDRDACIVKC
jgi:hypothetical protein